MAAEAGQNVTPFHQLLTGAQSSLYAFIFAMMGDANTSRDVLQETNLALWEKADLFDHQQSFLPWAYRFAHLQVLAYRKRQQRDRLMFSDELVEALAADLTSAHESVDDRLLALEECVKLLPDAHRDMIRRFYERGHSIATIGDYLGKSSNCIAIQLYRIRKALSVCIERALRAGACDA